MAERQIAILICCAAAAVLSACGSPATEVAGDAWGVEPLGAPTARSCGIHAVDREANQSAALGTVESRHPRPPAAGVYTYRTVGRSTVPGEAVWVRNLPARTELVVTEVRRFGDLACFRMQKRYAPGLTNTETYLVRDDEFFLVAIRIDALGASEEVRPAPPVLFASDTGARWLGRFSGATSGSYAVTGLGRRTHRLGDRRLRVIGLRSVVNYHGAVSGTQAATTWITAGRRLIVSEKLALRGRLGVTEVRLRLRRSLLRR